ncbi:hypothetical protein BU14_0340s0014 [Porphyra umbilicalis]|uniref:Uncharacterized protein n=1 Tax=Porphyra umbilicalis TaxID=2786 RepID=A0A1X6NYB1_PORUM|nr:hypothetical protein BU14_0340s0014 [Porphyra umbilicalis]|eukprot:OSX73530.1 hypothetical protein BU14_0340s0014 [Porphyra umbilicalis]
MGRRRVSPVPGRGSGRGVRSTTSGTRGVGSRRGHGRRGAGPWARRGRGDAFCSACFAAGGGGMRGLDAVKGPLLWA